MSDFTENNPNKDAKPQDNSDVNPAANGGSANANNYEPNMDMVGKENKYGAVDGEPIDRPAFMGPTTAAAVASTTSTVGSSPALRQHGFSQPGQHIGAGLNYYSIYTTIDITPTGIPQLVIPKGYPLGVYSDTIINSQYMFDKVVETISLRAQPVVMSKVTTMPASNFTALPDFAPTTGNVYMFSFIIEHNGAWDTKQAGWMAEGHPPIKGGPTPWDTNPDLGQTIAENLQYLSPAFVNTGTGAASTNTFTVVAQGPFTA